MSKKSYIDSVKVGSSCGEEWERMEGSDRVRFCSHCAKHVNNLSEMTRKEATRFVRASGGNICIRYVVNPRTKRPIFAEQLLQITRRAPGIAAGALTASIAVSTSAYAQERDPAPMPIPPVVEQTMPVDGVPTPATIQDLPNAIRNVTMGDMVAVVEFKSPLSRAVADEDKGIIRELIARGVNVNAREESHSRITPMFLAVETGDLDIVQMLLDAGAKLNVRSTSRETPLMHLDSDATRELVELLVRYGAKVNVTDSEGNTPLIHAMEYSTPEAAKALIDAGADVTAANNDGETALMKAAERSDVDNVRALIFAGADINARDKDGDSAWKYADSREVQDILLSFGITLTDEERADLKPETDAASPDPPQPDPTPEPTPPLTH